MRLRNIPGARDVIKQSKYCIKEPEQYRGRWAEVFGNDHPIRIEIGMGKGRFLMDQAAAHPEINYIGIEMYSSVLIRAIEKAEEREQSTDSKKAEECEVRADSETGKECSKVIESADESFRNFVFIRMDATYIEEVFGEGEVDRIYLNFSDPWPKERHAKRRLTSSLFLKRYEKILAKNAWIEFKTDNEALFDFSLEEARESGWELCAVTRDLHHDRVMMEGNIMTEYEEKFSSLGNPIFKMIARP